ncbi:hypothetical protein IE81DRAFT_88158 [Ceraceosorus guamensis]|uniref:Uncharacterized protein n=1 Tax=Ceraceosorus guamensis TaxID=1522189 RepID=A0A316W1I1_9BASI|nr:hypothetical protein IE81DRAFT_88158 [Ceraceosorus guamensis]PWN43364.1 hypothetical protein IE81DRAFT_88158 [Ceraceosorus guamensis]
MRMRAFCAKSPRWTEPRLRKKVGLAHLFAAEKSSGTLESVRKCDKAITMPHPMGEPNLWSHDLIENAYRAWETWESSTIVEATRERKV